MVVGRAKGDVRNEASFAGATTTRFTATSPAGTPLPAILTFTDKVTDSAGRTATDIIGIFVGADTITATNVTYAISKSRLQVAAAWWAPH